MTKRVFDINLDMRLWDEIEAGDLSFIVRNDKENFQRGDIVNLYKYDCTDYSSDRFVANDGGRTSNKKWAKHLTAIITFVWPLPTFGSEQEVVLSVRVMNKEAQA